MGGTVAELGQRLSWAELLHWVVVYRMEAEQALPPDKRPVRPKTPEEAARALDQALGIRAKKPKRTP